jgi:hypothetical protein
LIRHYNTKYLIQHGTNPCKMLLHYSIL